MRSRSAVYRTLFTLTMAGSIAVLFIACNDDGGGNGDPEDEATTGVGLECSPGEVLDCECNDGSSGTQVCLATGDEVGPCDCGGGYMGYDGETPQTVATRVELSGSGTVSLEFTWHDTAGRPAPTDLDIELPGQIDPIVQVFSSADSVPYVRSGLVVKELVVGRTYTATLGDGHVKIVGADGSVALDVLAELPSFDEITYVSPEPSIYAAPVVVGSVREN